MKKHRKHLDVLSKIADALEPVSNASIAAAVVYKNSVVAVGINQRKSHPFAAQFRKNEHAIYLHAETDAIKNALKHISVEELSKASLYIARTKQVSSTDDTRIWGLAKPCEGCQKAIATFGIRNVYYTCDDQGFECV
jgi:tRNA(Arg) A34 adenosine deaminase TadA